MKTTIICNQKTEYAIVIPAVSAPVEQTAAEELQLYLKKALGAELSICKEGEPVSKAFYIGHTEYAKAAGINGKSEENWIIKLLDENVILTGGVKENDRGIIYAVYHFLEDIVGIRWWSVWEEYVPELNELVLDSELYKEGTPFFEHRKVLGFRHNEDFYYDARTRCNVVGDDGLENGVYHESIKKLGGALPFGRPHHVHTIDKYIPGDKYFKDHPEWFAWSNVEGRRVPYAHYCLENDELNDVVTEKLLAYIEEDKALSKEKGVPMPDYYDISFPDVMGGFCECEKCQAAIEKGGTTGYALKFVNKIARKVKEKHPDVMLETLAYAVYMNPPKDDTLPDKNVMIRLANIYIDIINGPQHKNNKWYYDMVQKWSDICKKTGSKYQIWEYTFNLFVNTPLPVFNRLSDSFKAYADNNVCGMFVENERPSTDMWDLLQFMLLHLCEDPYADADALIDDFVSKYYGPAASYIKEYLNELSRSVADHPNAAAFCGIESAHFSFLDYKAVKKGMSLLEKAAEVVGDDPVLGPRVRYVLTSLGSALLMKYFDLKKAAEKDGEAFEYDREAIRQFVVDGYKEALKHPRCSEAAPSSKVKNQIEYFSNMVLTPEPETAPLPAELADVNPDDVYQFFYKNSSRYNVYAELYGASFVDDPDSSLGRVQKLCREDAVHPLEVAQLLTTSRDVEGGKGISIQILKDNECVSKVELFKEDIVPDTYHLYKIGSVSGIQEAGHVRADIFGNNYEWLHISGIAEILPMDACDVYLSMKFTGEHYGGKKGEQEAVYLDRAIIVRK